jgi:CheY-like chemotaxis protein
LTIVEQLVKLQGGTIGVESEEGKGSKFTFSLPFKIGEKPFREKVNGTRSTSTALKGVRVLVVEDNQLNQMVTEHLLLDWEMKVDIAANGQIALDMLAEQPYDIILMDLQMPVMDGYDTTRYIRNRLKGSVSQIPIIALTANAFYGMDDECMKIGMNDYLSKPFEKNVLFSKIQACVSPNGSGDKLSSNHNETQTQVRKSSQKFENINMTYLKEVSGGDEFIFKLAINKYLESTPDSLDLINEHLADSDYDGLGKAVHKLKSSVATMGMKKAKDTIIGIENILRNNLDKKPIPALVQQLEGMVQKSFSELRIVLGE